MITKAKHKIKGLMDRVSIWVVILGFSIISSGMGAVIMVQNVRFTNFVECQANYNQESSEARTARIPAGTRERRTFYRWLKTLPPALATPDGQEPDPELVRKFTRRLNKALEAYDSRNEIEADNPYPAEPDETCGGVL